MTGLVEALKARWLGDICAEDRDPMFLIGDQHKFPGHFLVLGTFWRRRRPDEHQLALLLVG